MTARLAIAALAMITIVLPLDANPAPDQLFGCSISTSGVAFGTYSVFNTSPTDSTGTVFYQCTLGVLVRVELNRGSSSTFDPRTLRNGAQVLNYNLYLDTNHTTIWGDGTGTTGRISHVAIPLFQYSATVFGRLPAQQDVGTGPYSDSVTATIIF
ncbi:MAG TPA: spore coat U domain-containing protein [Vicinamibacterales bacterium]|nr:spore coat U domain-containing protein [Vicinamibacterales bacterium]